MVHKLSLKSKEKTFDKVNKAVTMDESLIQRFYSEIKNIKNGNLESWAILMTKGKPQSIENMISKDTNLKEGKA